MKNKPHMKASFRDPSGFVYTENGVILRRINQCYKEHFQRLIESGLYKKLVELSLIIPHDEIGETGQGDGQAYKTIKPEKLAYISYPYEWSFSQLKDAAMATLAIAKNAIGHGMMLKDASAYNIQFHKGKPLLIDTLSFENYREGEPWIAYRQFCQHFLAPLALMAYRDIRLGQLLRVHIDGIPLDLANSLLPARTRLKFSILTHIHFHSKSQKRYEDRAIGTARKVSRRSLLALFDSLETAVRRLSWEPGGTEWAEYYDDTNYSEDSFRRKGELIAGFLDEIKPKSLWDLGANTGQFSRIASEAGIETVSFDIDPAAVEKNYRYCREKKIANCLPLLIDLTNPSPGIGWAGEERMSLVERGPVECVMALALIHHLAISNNLPLGMVAEFFCRICRCLIIEFVPKEDSQVQRLLRTRADIFPDYTKDGMESAFGQFFEIRKTEPIIGSERVLYLMYAKDNPVR